MLSRHAPLIPASHRHKSWVDSCFQETLLPGLPWHRLRKGLQDILATEYLQDQVADPQRAYILSKILGDAFMEVYFPDVHKSNDGLTAEEDVKLTRQALLFLEDKMQLIISKVNGTDGGDDHPLCESMKQFQTSAQHIFYIGLNRELYKIEEEGSYRGTRKVHQEPSRQQLDSSNLKVVAHLSVDKSIKVFNAKSLPNEETASMLHSESTRKISPSPYSQLLKKTISPPHLKPSEKAVSLPYTESFSKCYPDSLSFLEESILKILEKDGKQIKTVVQRLYGRPLPCKLRFFIWTDVLYNGEREKHVKGTNVERLLRERFGKTVARHVGELNLKRATQSPIKRMIENTVLELYDSVPSLHACSSLRLVKEACKVLNVLYVYNRAYEPYLVYWLLPLQLTCANRDPSIGPENVYELAMYLDLLSTSLYPTWSLIFAMADLVFAYLEEKDHQLFSHLLEISRVGITVEVKDFMVNLITQEWKTAENILKEAEKFDGNLRRKSTKPLATYNKQEMLSDPRLYIRKWLCEGFVSVLDIPAVMFIWDQLFLNDWSSAVFQDFALVIILLLRDDFLAASDHKTMWDVFLNKPRQLLLADIRNAWILLQRGQNCMMISQCNRLSPNYKQEESAPPVQADGDVQQSMASPTKQDLPFTDVGSVENSLQEGTLTKGDPPSNPTDPEPSQPVSLIGDSLVSEAKEKELDKTSNTPPAPTNQLDLPDVFNSSAEQKDASVIQDEPSADQPIATSDKPSEAPRAP